MNPTLPPRCEWWPAPPARHYALFAEPPGATGAGALELVVTGRVIDPRELCLTPAVTARFHAVGNALCDWIWLSAGLSRARARALAGLAARLRPRRVPGLDRHPARAAARGRARGLDLARYRRRVRRGGDDRDAPRAAPANAVNRPSAARAPRRLRNHRARRRARPGHQRRLAARLTGSSNSADSTCASTRIRPLP